VTHSDDPAVYPVGDFILTRTYTLADASGRVVVVAQTITVDDVTPPSITCPAPVTTTNNWGQCYATGVVLGAPVTGDNCAVASVVNDAPTQFPVGNTTVTWTVTDLSGLTNFCTQVVTVLDVQPPSATAGSIAACYTTQGAAEAAAIAATQTSASDNCGLGTLTAVTTGDPCSATITVAVPDIHGNFTNIIYNTRIDADAPVLGAIAAVQGASNVKNSANTVLQGVVSISVVAGDNCGLVGGHPSVDLVNGVNNEAATFVSGVGSVDSPFLYTWTVTSATAGGAWTATVIAADLCQQTNDTFTLEVNKNEISGQIELQGFAGTSRTVVFKASDGASSNATVLKTWTVPLTFTNGVADFTLTAVPDGTLGLSAKTDWNLRRKLGVTPMNGQATANFTGASYLWGGDVGTNSLSVNKVLSDDYFAVVNVWGSTNTPASDITGEGAINVLDYSQIAEHWQKTGDPE
jgi:hypothetical protein